MRPSRLDGRPCDRGGSGRLHESPERARCGGRCRRRRQRRPVLRSDASAVDREVGAGRGEGEGDGPPDAAVGAGDEGGAAVTDRRA